MVCRILLFCQVEDDRFKVRLADNTTLALKHIPVWTVNHSITFQVFKVLFLSDSLRYFLRSAVGTVPNWWAKSESVAYATPQVFAAYDVSFLSK